MGSKLVVFLECTSLIPASGLLHLLFLQLGIPFLGSHMAFSLTSDFYSDVNSLAKSVLIPPLKTVKLHPYYSLLHSNNQTLYYIDDP